MSLAIPIDLLLADAAQHRERLGRPLVTVTYAQSLDGSITAVRGSRLAISGPESLALTHQLRAAHDAIMVGIGTVLADRPHLNVRLATGKDPQPVVLDSHLRFPLGESRLQARCLPVWVVTTENADRQKQQELEATGTRVLRVPADGRGRVGLKEVLERLAALGISSLMVEGGARVITSFLSEHFVDLLVITITPIMVGGLHAVEGLLPANGRGSAGADGFPRLQEMGYRRFGGDLVVWGKLG